MKVYDPKDVLIEREVSVEKRVWAPDDTYLVVPEIQVGILGEVKQGETVRVIILRVPA